MRRAPATSLTVGFPSVANACCILGVPLAVLNREQVRDHVSSWLRGDRPRLIVTPNPEFCVRAFMDPSFRRRLAQADLRVPDGVGLALAARLLYGVPVQRYSGVDFTLDLARLAAGQGTGIYFVGGRPGVARQAADTLQRYAPGWRVSGAESGDGPDSPGGTPGTINRIRQSAATIVLVAYGAPRQEAWLAAAAEQLPAVRLLVGVGGTFDYLAGVVPRAPHWLRGLGLEWLYRLVRQPRRLPRILVATVVFPVLALAERLVRLRRPRAVS